VAKILMTADDLLGSPRLRDEDGRAVWDGMNDGERATLLGWVNQARWTRGRRTRLKEAINALNAQGASGRNAAEPTGGITGAVVDGVLDALRPWN
jgi:hypothetical protein